MADEIKPKHKYSMTEQAERMRAVIAERGSGVVSHERKKNKSRILSVRMPPEEDVLYDQMFKALAVETKKAGVIRYLDSQVVRGCMRFVGKLLDEPPSRSRQAQVKELLTCCEDSVLPIGYAPRQKKRK